jgi:hypothetical protein
VTELATAAGIGILRATGVEFEAEISFSGLAQLLTPLRADFGPHNIAWTFPEVVHPALLDFLRK